MSEQTASENRGTSVSIATEESQARKLPDPPSGPRKLPPIPLRRPSLPLIKRPLIHTEQNNSDSSTRGSDPQKIVVEKLNESEDVEVASKLKILLTSQPSPQSPKKVPPPLPKRPLLKPLPRLPPNNINPSPRTPKVSAKGPLPKRPSHLPPPPPPKISQTPNSLPPVPENHPATSDDNVTSVISSSVPESSQNNPIKESKKAKRRSDPHNRNRDLTSSTSSVSLLHASIDDLGSALAVANATPVISESAASSSSDVVTTRRRTQSIPKKPVRSSSQSSYSESSGRSASGGMGGSSAPSATKSDDLQNTQVYYVDLNALDLEAFYPHPDTKKERHRLSASKVRDTARNTLRRVAGLFKRDKEDSPNREEESGLDESEAKEIPDDKWISKKRTKREFPPLESDIPKEIYNLVDVAKCQKEGYYVEFGVRTASKNPPLEIEYTEEYVPYYAEYLAAVDHVNFVAETDENEPFGPVIVSIENKKRTRSDKVKCIVHTKKGHERCIVDVANGHSKALASLTDIPQHLKFIRVKGRELVDMLADMERKELVMYQYCKFGLIYWKDGMTEDEIFATDKPTPDFEEFQNFLGKKIRLQGWDKFKGGLDTKNDSTGEYSIYTTISGIEIMFHVVTLLPSQVHDPQRVEKKRHIGNDVVVIIFKEGEQCFDPFILTSQFNHIFVVVQKVVGLNPTHYRVAIVHKAGTVPSLPDLPFPPVFEKNEEFHKFLLTKCVNAERAAMQSPEFKGKMMRTRKEELAVIVKKCLSARRTALIELPHLGAFSEHRSRSKRDSVQ